MKVTMYPSITVDGFIANPQGECYSWINAEDEARYEKEIKRCGCALLGSNTYNQYIKDYPLKNGATSFVCTSRTDLKDEEKIKFVSGDPHVILQKIEQYGFSEVILSGGGDTNGRFASAGVVNEIILSINSIVLGEGIPLFGKYKPNLKLQLLSTNNDIKDVVQNRYKVLM